MQACSAVEPRGHGPDGRSRQEAPYDRDRHDRRPNGVRISWICVFARVCRSYLYARVCVSCSFLLRYLYIAL
jgi:hypothetical protein